MKILYESRNTDSRYLAMGLKSVFESLGHNFLIYTENSLPLFYIFDDFGPDIYIGSGQFYNKVLSKCLAENNTKFYTKEAIGFAADPINFPRGKIKKEFHSQISFVGEPTEIAENIINRLNNVKVFRDSFYEKKYWKTPYYLGMVRPDQLSNIFASSKISLDLTNGERFYQIVSSDGFCLCLDEDLTLERLIEDIKYYLLANDEIYETTKKGVYTHIMTEHTYFHRIFHMLNKLGFKSEADKTLEYYYKNVYTSV